MLQESRERPREARYCFSSLWLRSAAGDPATSLPPTGTGGTTGSAGTAERAPPTNDASSNGSSGTTGDADGATNLPGNDASSQPDTLSGSITDAASADATPLPTLPGCDAATAHARADQSLNGLIDGFWNTGTSTSTRQSQPTESRRAIGRSRKRGMRCWTARNAPDLRAT